MDHLCYLCNVFVMLSRQFIPALWSPKRKELTSWHLFVMFIVILLLSHLVSWDRCGILLIIFMAIFSAQFSVLHYFIFSVYTNLNFNRMFSSTSKIFLQIFDKKDYNLTFLQQFFNICYLF